MESYQAYPYSNLDPEPHPQRRLQETLFQPTHDMGSYQAYPYSNLDPEPHAPSRVQGTPFQNKDNMESYQAYSHLYFESEPHGRHGEQGTPVQMDVAQPYIGHQLHDRQVLQYSRGPGDLEGGHYQVESYPFQANLSGSMSSWTPDRNLNDSVPFQTNGPPGFRYDDMGFDPIFKPQGIELQPMWLPIADAVAPMPQVDYEEREAVYMSATCKELITYCKERGMKTSRTRKKDEYVQLAEQVLPGVDCWALSNVELRARCKARNAALPGATQYDSKAVMARKLTEDDAKWGI